ncbi:MarR family winged helix-turn-helix transcriptional regulator [Lactococcus lactis]|uniref:MarR family winged helix-turn-helix transcriptional regulator n=1 Tax=Lactococcus lactis TaxID=1358 RepID=UPI0028BF22C2|nr:MarR family transcriptional regulator [Lactococcus lactis]WNN67637.1 MarR family transcriptional regulator [Lactococcus lactis]WPK09616.1 MarR family transcriptional regulator [Lactococcus lactis]
MEDYKFTDRPNSQRIKATAEEYHNIDDTLVLNFLNFQWTYREMQKQYDILLDKFELTESRFIILMFLKRAEENKLLPSEIAEKLGSSRPTVSKILKAMEQNELVEKIHSNNDKRSSYFKISSIGLRTLEKFIPHNFEAVKTIFAGFNSDDLNNLSNVLESINHGTSNLKKELE